jgi:hypothetical protein
MALLSPRAREIMRCIEMMNYVEYTRAQVRQINSQYSHRGETICRAANLSIRADRPAHSNLSITSSANNFHLINYR